MKNYVAYDNWRREGKKVETLDQAMYTLVNEITKRSLLEQVPQEFCEEEINGICSLQESFDEFTNLEYGRPFEDFKCEEITSELLEAFREFLQTKEPEGGYEPATVHFMTIGNILYLSNANHIADWDSELLNKYKSFSPILS